MDKAKRARLEAVGFQVGSVADFLGPSAEENELIELQLALSDSLRRRRAETHRCGAFYTRGLTGTADGSAEGRDEK